MAAKKKAAKTKRKDPAPGSDPGGRPSKFSRTLADEICRGLGDGASLRKLCRDNPDYPHAQTIRRWMLGQGIPPNDLEWFRTVYREARLLYEDHVFEELGDVRTETSTQPGDVARDALWSNNVKWSLARLNRAKFGDRSELGVSGTSGQPPIATSSVNVNLANLNTRDQAKLRELARQAIEGADE